PRPVTNADECFVDATCYSASEDVQTLARATALLLFVKNGGVGQCTGTLINGPDGDRQLLTANHCIRTAAEAASVEAFWDFRTSACGGAGMTYTKTAGATLLTTSATTDVTLLRMTSLPSGRWLMGWATDILPTGTLLYRVANPAVPNSTNVYYQAYSVSAVSASAVSCASAPRPSFIYSTRVTGGVGSGSSGAASIIAGGYIVGQLLGGCALGTPDGCSSLTSVMDGSLRASYPVLQPYLDPITTPGCTTTATNICLQNGRFSVSINYRNQFANPPQTGSFVGAQLLAGSQNPDVATFGISSAQAIEVVVRIQDARPFGINRFDVYYGGLTDLEYTVSVTDTQKGTTRTYRNAPGVVGGGVDRTSFPAN
ncbi:MAG TPA: hypothetical protein VF266_06190, partial [Thermoanaerobaculia bacterium]